MQTKVPGRGAQGRERGRCGSGDGLERRDGRGPQCNRRRAWCHQVWDECEIHSVVQPCWWWRWWRWWWSILASNLRLCVPSCPRICMVWCECAWCECAREECQRLAVMLTPRLGFWIPWGSGGGARLFQGPGPSRACISLASHTYPRGPSLNPQARHNASLRCMVLRAWTMDAPFARRRRRRLRKGGGGMDQPWTCPRSGRPIVPSTHGRL